MSLAAALLSVIRPDAKDFAGWTDLHDFGCHVAADVVAVGDDDGLYSPENSGEVETEIGIGCETAQEIVAKGGLSLYAAVTAEELERNWRNENDFVVVMIENTVDVVAVPGVDPVLREVVREFFLQREQDGLLRFVSNRRFQFLISRRELRWVMHGKPY